MTTREEAAKLKALKAKEKVDKAADDPNVTTRQWGQLNEAYVDAIDAYADIIGVEPYVAYLRFRE
jgi:hypothetical protein